MTVFTPTYNRRYIIENLYRSLQRQTCRDFEWLVVDDGSSDKTSELFEKWLCEQQFPIRYIFKENGGKHRAINQGVKAAKGELFFIVDSDDYLADDAIEKIIDCYAGIESNKNFGGLCGLKCYPNGEKVGGGSNFGILDCNSLEFRFKYKNKGDMAEVIRTDVMKEYPIPEFEGEKFCPEAVFFNRIAQKYKLRYFFEKIYICDYLPDGLTARITKIRMESPQASMICYSELTKCDIPAIQKIKAAINYWRFSFCSKKRMQILVKGIGLLWLSCMPIGYYLYIRDLKQMKQ